MLENSNLYSTTKKLLTKKKGILAADQSTKTISKQLVAVGAGDDAETRRLYRQLLFTTPGLEKYVSGIILYDTTLRNQTDDGTPFVDYLIAKGIVPIIKVDKSTTPHTGFEGEVVTEGLDGLADRLTEYYEMGARAAKWRAVFNISKQLPTEQNILFDCIQLVRYAALCHEAGIVPIVEPEIIYDGDHDIERAEEVTTIVLSKLFDLLGWYGVDLKAVILKSSMVLAGKNNQRPSSPEEVADATLRTLKQSVPQSVPGIVFLSGGQTPEQATTNFNAIAKFEKTSGGLPWEVAFSFSRALEETVQMTWQGKKENVQNAQNELLKRLQLNVLADMGNLDSTIAD
jgi:fructose-bisphosphate aldolase class I